MKKFTRNELRLHHQRVFQSKQNLKLRKIPAGKVDHQANASMQTPSGKCILDQYCAKLHVHIQAQPANPKIEKPCCQVVYRGFSIEEFGTETVVFLLKQSFCTKICIFYDKKTRYFITKYITIVSQLYNNNQAFFHQIEPATWINQLYKALSCIGQRQTISQNRNPF